MRNPALRDSQTAFLRCPPDVTVIQHHGVSTSFLCMCCNQIAPSDLSSGSGMAAGIAAVSPACRGSLEVAVLLERKLLVVNLLLRVTGCLRKLRCASIPVKSNPFLTSLIIFFTLLTYLVARNRAQSRAARGGCHACPTVRAPSCCCAYARPPRVGCCCGYARPWRVAGQPWPWRCSRSGA